MTKDTKEKYPSTFTIDTFSSTAYLANNEVKIPVGSTETVNEKEYNPFEHRQTDHPNSFTGALIHLLKSSLGTGILAIPSAFKSVGLLIGLLGTILVGLLCTHTIHLLVSASQEICKRSKVPQLGFAETAEAVFKHGPKKLRGWSSFAKYFVDIALVLTYYVGNAVYVVFIAGQIKEVVDHFHPDWKDFGEIYYMLVIMVLLMVCCQIKELKYLVPFSFIANTTMVVAFAITLYYMFNGIQDIKIHERPLVKPIEGLPLFFSTVIFAMEGIGTILPVENSLRKPEQFLGCPGILNVAMTCVVVLYTVIGFFGYLKFGEAAEASITKNLPAAEIPAQVAKVSISIAVFFTFMLQFYVPVDITWRKVVSYRVPERFHNLAQVIMRLVLVVFVTAIAASVPDLGTIIDLVGAIFFSTLGLFVPAVIDIVLNWEGDMGCFHWKLWKNLTVIILALFALVSGTYYAIVKLFNGE